MTVLPLPPSQPPPGQARPDGGCAIVRGRGAPGSFSSPQMVPLCALSPFRGCVYTATAKPFAKKKGRHMLSRTATRRPEIRPRLLPGEALCALAVLRKPVASTSHGRCQSPVATRSYQPARSSQSTSQRVPGCPDKCRTVGFRTTDPRSLGAHATTPLGRLASETSGE